MRLRPTILLLSASCAATGCVIAVENSFTVRDVHTIVLDINKGDVLVEARPGDQVRVAVDFGGLGQDVGHRVEDGVLFLDYDCGGPELCGGDISVEAPPRTLLELDLGAGDVTLEGMSGDLRAAVGAGAISASDLHAPTAHFATGAGEIAASFGSTPSRIDAVVATGSIDLEVPSGSYALFLDAKAGSIDVDGIVEDPEAPNVIQAETAAGSISIDGR